MASEQTSSVTSIPKTAAPAWALPALILFIFTVAHLALALRFPLANDETYYWEWSRRPAWGYYDQGPMIAWWIRAGCWVFGDAVLGIRFPIILASLLTQLSLFLLFRDLVGRKAAILATVVAGITPLATVGGFVATYDPLFVLFWSWAMYFASRSILFRSQSAWFGLGASVGLGLLSKHTMLLFIPCFLLFVCANKEFRNVFHTQGPYLSVSIAALIFAPSLSWQAGHDWMTFRHLFLLTGKGSDRGIDSRLLEFLGSQAALVSPLLFWAFILELARAIRERNPETGRARSFLFWFSAPVLTFFLLLTIKSRVQANWAACAWLSPAGLYACAVYSERPGIKRGFHFAAVSLTVILSLMMTLPELRIALGIQVPQNWDIQIAKLYGGAELGAAADREREAMARSGERVAVGAVTYDNASRLAFYMSGKPQTWCLFLGTRLNSYTLWNESSKPVPGGSALMVDDLAPDDPERPNYELVFDRVEPVPDPVRVYWRGVYRAPIRSYHLYRCYGYRPGLAAETPSGG